MYSEKIKELINYIEKTKTIDFQIERKDLREETDYIKNSYFKLLAVLLVQGTEIQPGQKNLYERLITGAKCDYTFHDFICQALDIEIEEYVEFMNQIKELEIRYSFVLDVLLLTVINEKKEEQIKLAAHFIEALRIEKCTLKYLCSLSKAILEQDAVQYMYCDAKRPQEITEEFGKYYISADMEPGIWNYNSECLLYSPKLAEIDTHLFEELVKTNLPIIHMKNIYIKPHQYKFVFLGHKKVIFENCYFESNQAIEISECEELEIIGCKFLEFSFRVLSLTNVPKVLMKNTIFQNCILSCSSYYSSEEESRSFCIAISKGIEEITYIEDCIFQDCRVENEYDYDAKSILFNRICQVKNSSIKNCLGKMNCRNGYIEKSMSSALFPSMSVNISCEISNSGYFR